MGYTRIMKIGIFDSGRGARFVAEKLSHLLPDLDYIIVDDQPHAPYGNRSLGDVARLTKAAIQPLLADCPIIIIACNSATAAAIDQLRRDYPEKIFIGFEPMIKPAALTSKTRRITLLATNATSSSPRTRQLIKQFAKDIIIDTPDTRSWASLIDAHNGDSIDLKAVASSIRAGSDTVIIGCTHYTDLTTRLAEYFPTVRLLEPTEAIARQLKRSLKLEPR